jgi:hypothetical protein
MAHRFVDSAVVQQHNVADSRGAKTIRQKDASSFEEQSDHFVSIVDMQILAVSSVAIVIDQP